MWFPRWLLSSSSPSPCPSKPQVHQPETPDESSFWMSQVLVMIWCWWYHISHAHNLWKSVIDPIDCESNLAVEILLSFDKSIWNSPSGKTGLTFPVICTRCFPLKSIRAASLINSSTFWYFKKLWKCSKKHWIIRMNKCILNNYLLSTASVGAKNWR